MKKNLIIFCVLPMLMTFVFSQNYVPKIPTFVPSRYNAIGGYHVTDTTDYFTIFANPAGIPATDGKATWFNIDTRLSNPELLLEFVKIAIDAGFDSEDTTNAEISEDLLALIGENGINIGYESIGPLALGSIHNAQYGTFGWALFSKIRYFGFIPSFTHMDALVGIDNMLQLTYATPIIETDLHYISAGLSTKGLFLLEAGVSNVEPLGLLTDISNYSSFSPMLTHAGFSFDVGLYYKFIDLLSVGLVWRDAFNLLWTSNYALDSFVGSDNSLKIPSVSSTSSVRNPSVVDIGIGVNIPRGILETIITRFIIMADYRDVLVLIDNNALGRNPILNLSVGSELTLFDVLSIRAGISDMYLNAGVGLRFGKTNFDFAIFGKELGLEPGSLPQLNTSIALSINY